jgi:hypothetical protein
MDAFLPRLEPIPAKFRSLAAAAVLAARAGNIPNVLQCYEQAGRLLIEFVNAGGLDDPKNVVTAYQIRGQLEGFDLRPGSNDWSQLWYIAKQRLLTPEQLAAFQADFESPTPPPEERFVEHYANHCNLIADWMDKDLQRIREDMFSATHGVSLLDAALILTDEDRQLAPQMVQRWQKLRSPKRPPPIGNCPQHSQRQLFVPAALCDWIETIEGKRTCAEHQLRQRLAKKARPPRQE